MVANQKAGFRLQCEYRLYKKPPVWKNLPEAKQIVKATERDKSGILAMDFDISGENRKNLLYPYLENSYIFKKNRNAFS